MIHLIRRQHQVLGSKSHNFIFTSFYDEWHNFLVKNETIKGLHTEL